MKYSQFVWDRHKFFLYADLPVMIKYFPLQQQLWLYTNQWQLVSSTSNSGPGKLPISVGEETVISVKFSTLQWKAANVVLLWMEKKKKKDSSIPISLMKPWVKWAAQEKGKLGSP